MKSVNIKGQRYKIIYVDVLDEGRSLAECDKLNKIIRVVKSLNDIEKGKALLHEIGHAIIHETGIDQAIDHGLEEIITENFSTTIHRIFFQSRKHK